MACATPSERGRTMDATMISQADYIDLKDRWMRLVGEHSIQKRKLHNAQDRIAELEAKSDGLERANNKALLMVIDSKERIADLEQNAAAAAEAMGEILRLEVGIPLSILGRVREAYDGLRAALREGENDE